MYALVHTVVVSSVAVWKKTSTKQKDRSTSTIQGFCEDQKNLIYDDVQHKPGRIGPKKDCYSGAEEHKPNSAKLCHTQGTARSKLGQSGERKRCSAEEIDELTPPRERCSTSQKFSSIPAAAKDRTPGGIGRQPCNQINKNEAEVAFGKTELDMARSRRRVDAVAVDTELEEPAREEDKAVRSEPEVYDEGRSDNTRVNSRLNARRNPDLDICNICMGIGIDRYIEGVRNYLASSPPDPTTNHRTQPGVDGKKEKITISEPPRSCR
ncbi:hypothetical protein DFH06DRAFT_1148573 [Mycena polygramma]|nr:hypothetical protein DFH06DRAFT_1148573 [Mycena polygramma]